MQQGSLYKLSQLIPIIQSNSNTESVLEIEAKFGRKVNGRFDSSVPYVHYDRLLTYLRQTGEELLEESTVAIDGNDRRITTTTNSGNGVVWQRKNNIRHIEVLEYGLRISANLETPIDPISGFTPKTIRTRSRHSFELNQYIKVDMTEVMMHGQNKISRPIYEVEIEFNGSIDDLSIFEAAITRIFKLLRGTNEIYDIKTKNALVMSVAKALNPEKYQNQRSLPSNDTEFEDRDIKPRMVDARNIKRRDLVYGGIVGNETTNYIATYKADGLRKLLVIHATGIWLVYPPYEYNLVLLTHPLIKSLADTILDGELVQPKIDINIAYWYLGFDCLAFKGNHSVQNKPYMERKKVVDAVAKNLRSPILTVDAKDALLVDTPDKFFSIVKRLLDAKDDLPYNQDGLIFTPADTIYNPQSNRYPLYHRTLTVHPDVCKFKEGSDITIDFSIKWVSNKQLELYSYDREINQLVHFKGDMINPLTPEMIDHEHELTRGQPSGLIVEYEWSKNKLRPRRIRHDKSGPNGIEIALDDWEDIMHPIEIADIEGLTPMLTFAYHKRIKKGLHKFIPKNANILDIGSGRGGDAHRWKQIGAKVVAVEPNDSNRQELQRRISTFELEDQVLVVPTGGEATADITAAVKSHIGKADVVTLMLSMSFFWQSEAHLNSLVNTIITNIAPNGTILFLTIDGDTLVQLFEPALGGPVHSTMRVGSADITLHPQSTLIPYGRAVDFILNDTIVGAQREYVVLLNALTEKLDVFGFELTEIHRAEGEKLLQSDQYLYSSIYSYGYYTNTNPTLLNTPTLTPVYDGAYVEPVIKPITPPKTSPKVVKPVSPIKVTPKVVKPVTPVKVTTKVVKPVSPIKVTTKVVKPVSPVKVTTKVVKPVTPVKVTTKVVKPVTPLKPLITGDIVVDGGTKEQKDDKVKDMAVNRMAAGQYLDSLPVGTSVKPGEPASGDDKYAIVNCRWFPNLVRIATIGDGSCFIHSVMKACFSTYQNNADFETRDMLAQQCRRDLAVVLMEENPQYPGHTYWESTARGSFPRLLMQEIKSPDIMKYTRVDYSLYGLQRLFNSFAFLGDECYEYVADVIDYDIYVLRATSDDLHIHLNTHRTGRDRHAIVIVGNGTHYEVIAEDTSEGFKTIFEPDHPFIQEILSRGEREPENDFDPDSAFVHNFWETFKDKATGVVDFPESIYDLFAEDDIFIQCVNRNFDRIRNYRKPK